MNRETKPVIFIGSSREDLRKFPEPVRLEIGHALHQAQIGENHPGVKAWEGFPGATILQIADDHDSDTYRCIYTAKLAGCVYVLHAFKKKSKSGISTPAKEVELVRARLKVAQADHAARQQAAGGSQGQSQVEPQPKGKERGKRG